MSAPACTARFAFSFKSKVRPVKFTAYSVLWPYVSYTDCKTSFPDTMRFVSGVNVFSNNISSSFTISTPPIA